MSAHASHLLFSIISPMAILDSLKTRLEQVLSRSPKPREGEEFEPLAQPLRRQALGPRNQRSISGLISVSRNQATSASCAAYPLRQQQRSKDGREWRGERHMAARRYTRARTPQVHPRMHPRTQARTHARTHASHATPHATRHTTCTTHHTPHTTRHTPNTTQHTQLTTPHRVEAMSYPSTRFCKAVTNCRLRARLSKKKTMESRVKNRCARPPRTASPMPKRLEPRYSQTVLRCLETKCPTLVAP